MHPSSILSYYPQYSILDEILSYSSEYKTLNLYIDLKNVLQTLYMEHCILNIIDGTEKGKFTDTSIFSSILQFLSFHKIYACKRRVNINFFIFFETGKSSYHLNISKKYKIGRRIDNLYGLDKEKRDIFFETVQHNLKLTEKALNKIPNTKVFRLEYLEADFIPYYLISRKKVEIDPTSVHVVYSNDHDLLQTITAGDNVYVFQKVPQYKRIVKKGEVLKRELKVDTNEADNLQTIAMAIRGDAGDDVDGIKGIGSATFIKNLDQIKAMIGSPEQLYNNVMAGNDIFSLTGISSQNKHLSKIINSEQDSKFISNNLKLVSFELISRAVEDPANTEMLEKKKHIQNILDDNRVAPKEPLKNALERNGVCFLGDEFDNLYYAQ